MRYATTVIIGAGQSGLAVSKHLSDRSIDHVLLERGGVANSWKTERWDSLRLLTPNWQSRLPGFAYDDSDPDGYMAMPEVVGHLGRYAEMIRAPIETHTRVERVVPAASGFEISTDRGTWRCRTLVLASGACNIATVPSLAASLDARIAGLTPMHYRNPQQLEPGGVLIVGGSATGVQLARELLASGRRVVLSIGEHVRVPRLYRGRDIQWWMDATGAMDAGYREVDDIDRARRVPSLQLIGTPERSTIDLNSLGQAGAEIVGRLVTLDGLKAGFSGSLANHCALADLKMNRLLEAIDAWVDAGNADFAAPPPERFAPTLVGAKPRLSLDLADAGIRTVIWATGYRPDHSWLDVPVLDPKGRIRHDGGIALFPRLYVMGLPFMRRRKSSLIDGAGSDAADIVAHLSRHCLDSAAA